MIEKPLKTLCIFTLLSVFKQARQAHIRSFLRSSRRWASAGKPGSTRPGFLVLRRLGLEIKRMAARSGGRTVELSSFSTGKIRWISAIRSFSGAEAEASASSSTDLERQGYL